jgi:predicted ATPase
MIRRLYVHNFRCLENFELGLADHPSVLLIGKNGTGKTTLGAALEVLQKIGRGTNRVESLVSPKDLPRGRASAPMRFELEVDLNGVNYAYHLVLELPDRFREVRVAEERLQIDGEEVVSRELSRTLLKRSRTEFSLDWHLVALPIIQQAPGSDPIYAFRKWLASALILRPVPRALRGGSEFGSLYPEPEVDNFGDWFTGLVGSEPASYLAIDKYLKEILPDFHSVKNRDVGEENKSVYVRFSRSQENSEFRIEELSDGEKCFFIFALAVAANEAYGPLLCFWDEPDNFLAPSEVASSMVALRRAFRNKGQLIVTSHNPEAIRQFSDESTLLLFRKSHFEPTRWNSVEQLRERGAFHGSFVDALARGDVEP